MERLIILFLCLISYSVFAQKTELTLHINSGFFSFASNQEQKYNSPEDFNVNPYGSKSAVSYGLGAQIQKITESELIVGIQTGYESLASKVSFNDLVIDGATFTTHGKVVLRTNFIGLYPFFGNRFFIRKIPFDLSLGPDLGFGLGSKETTKTKNPKTVTSAKHSYPGLDLRLRISLTAFYKEFGLNTGYSFGGTNYTEALVGGNFENRSKYIRLGISYNIKPNVIRELFSK